MPTELLFIACLVGAAASLFWALWRLLWRDPIADRLSPGSNADAAVALMPGSAASGSSSGGMDLAQLLQQVGQKFGRPLQPKKEAEINKLRQRLSYAGINSRAGMSMFVGGRLSAGLIGVLGGALLGAIIGATRAPGLFAMLFGVLGGGLGYLLPTFWLDWRIRKNQLALEHALPDALDLLVVCVESGLTMDAAFQRVGREIALAHPSLARELATAHVETQMGVPRTDALRNIYLRTGSQAVQSLTAMLIQADRFGTSIAQALRIYADSLRVKRRFKAEERAATAAVKISFPLVLFVFPALLIVIGAPAFLRIMELNPFGNR